MTPDEARPEDLRVLVLAPRGRDGAVVRQVLDAHGLASQSFASLDELVKALRHGAGLAFVTEETLLDDDGLHELTCWLRQQPPWSDFPLAVLATRQAGRRSRQHASTLDDLGNVVLLERPLNAQTLVSAARSALRSRARQYQARRHLEEQERIGRENERLYQAERLALSQAAEARFAFSLAVEAAELGTFHCPMPMGAIEWNETCKRHFWLPPDAAVDFDLFYAIVHPEDLARTRRAVEAAVQASLPYDIEYRTLSPQGESRWLRAKGRAFHDAEGRVARFDGVTIDISQQKRMEAERESLLDAERQARADAEHASRSKDEFLATLSHELRTPLSAILGWVNLLRKRSFDPADVARGIDTIERNARAQSRLIDELLDMSRIIAGNVRLEQQPLMPAMVLDAVLASLQPGMDAKAIQVERDIDAALGPVAADAHRLQQIVWNLLSNAIKFTPPGGRICITLQREADAAALSIVDSGEGITADFLPHVFDRFRQADGSSTRQHGGLGLGLAIVRQLVDLHGGLIDASSGGAGQGATFTLRLPLGGVGAPPPPPPSADVVDAPTVACQDAACLVGLKGLHILLVDDDADGRDMVARTLADGGARVRQAGSAEEALIALREATPDLLISDIGMPRVDGYQLLQRVRGLGHALPAIALTAFARPEERDKALAAGYAVHLAKPVDMAELVAEAVRCAAPVSDGRSVP